MRGTQVRTLADRLDIAACAATRQTRAAWVVHATDEPTIEEGSRALTKAPAHVAAVRTADAKYVSIHTSSKDESK